jgi:signal peptidase complex subunit 2
LPRFSDEYTLSIASADPKSISAGKPVQFTKSITQWSPPPFSQKFQIVHVYEMHCVFHHIYYMPQCFRFTKDGVLVEGLFWKDVEALIDDYAAEPKKSK